MGKCSFVIILLLSLHLNVYAQEVSDNQKNNLLKYDTSNFIFDFFNQRNDSLFFEYGRVFLIPYEYYFNNEELEFVSEKTENSSGKQELKIYFKGKLLFVYLMKNNIVDGLCFIYYHNSEKVAYQGEFKNGLLHGPLFCFGDDGRVLFVLKFRRGKPYRIEYLFNIEQSKNNYKKINRRRFFRNGKSTGEVIYPFVT